MTQTLSFFFASMLLVLSACSTGKRSPSASAKTAPSEAEYANYAVDFMRTDKLTNALNRAEAEDKLVFVDFYTTWCLPCKLMDEDVFTDQAFGDYMNERFISVKIDAEAGNGPNLATLFGVQAYPTLLFLDSSGRVHAKKEGAAFQTELRQLGNQAIASTTGS